jgi:hypothetical protein
VQIHRNHATTWAYHGRFVCAKGCTQAVILRTLLQYLIHTSGRISLGISSLDIHHTTPHCSAFRCRLFTNDRLHQQASKTCRALTRPLVLRAICCAPDVAKMDIRQSSQVSGSRIHIPTSFHCTPRSPSPWTWTCCRLRFGPPMPTALSSHRIHLAVLFPCLLSAALSFPLL